METKLTLELPIQVQKYVEELKKIETMPRSKETEWLLNSYRFMIAEAVVKVLDNQE